MQKQTVFYDAFPKRPIQQLSASELIDRIINARGKPDETLLTALEERIASSQSFRSEVFDACATRMAELIGQIAQGKAPHADHRAVACVPQDILILDQRARP
ncbi:hypothetical protein Z946_1551 [Sulfitobacter noctilucicola]|uniref:Uncharacterized protein n=1 Tax=Sulfitobacter noctilucicola TaxID=1342301 RepID=A0A7W6Q363_9RHOB|nr:hypothetical protein [Sulfitobacter noctilucicola]KIN62688.1 hypothetical protein Z946_1551 [Sulfitobacter noctilucicola]MBB4172779.1 hypothetical protein [Sulfitobacter noctilucicola]